VSAGDLKGFAPVPTQVTLGDGTLLELAPVRLGELPRLLACARPLQDDLTAQPDWLALLLKHSDAVLELLSICSRRPRAWVDGLALDDAVLLCTALFEVNADFFVARVAPAVHGAAQRLGPMLHQISTAGTPPSRD